MRRQIILSSAIIMVGWLIEAEPSIADGALALGMVVWDDQTLGLHYSIQHNVADADTAASQVMGNCRGTDNSKIAAACRLIGTFRDQCVGVAVNGDAIRYDPSVHAVPLIAAGWAIEKDTATTASVAIAACEEMRSGRQKACQILYQVICDGTAK